jgi:hypothetical protein
MEIIVNAVIVQDFENIEKFQIKVNELNYIKVRKRLEFEKWKIILILKQMKDKGDIKSVWKPSNKKIQEKLNNLVNSKNIINNSIDKIREIFYKVNR